MNERESLLINLEPGEQVSIGSGQVIVTAKHKSGRRLSLHFSAEKGVAVEPVRVKEPFILKQA